MEEFLSLTVDKFTFRVATDRVYTGEGLWVKEEAGRLRVGIADFVQQRSGDVAFADVKPAGTSLAGGDELAVIETIKINLAYAAPVAGEVVEVNPAMTDAPEIINQDPYGAGWLAVIAPADWNASRANLLDAQAYFAKIQREAEAEAGNA